MDFIPRAFAIRYCDILNNMVLKFIQDHADFFSRNENGTYVFSGKNSKTKLTQIFSEYLSEELDLIKVEVQGKFPDVVTKHVFILQGTSPENNVLGNQFTDKIVQSRYFLLERDIHMDFTTLEKVWNNLFDKRFRLKQRSRNNGFFFLKHQNLNADQLGNILKLVYGNVNGFYSRRKEVLGDIAETTQYEFDGSKTMHDRLKLIVNETKEYVGQITKHNFLGVN